MQVRTPIISGNDPRAWADLKRWCGEVAAALQAHDALLHDQSVTGLGNELVRRWASGDSTSTWRMLVAALVIDNASYLPVEPGTSTRYERNDWAEIEDSEALLDTDEFTVYAAIPGDGTLEWYYTTDATAETTTIPIVGFLMPRITPYVSGDIVSVDNPGLRSFACSLSGATVTSLSGTVHLPLTRTVISQTNVSLSAVTEVVFVEVDTSTPSLSTVRSEASCPSNTDRYVYWPLRQYTKESPGVFRQSAIYWEYNDIHLESVLA